MKRAAVEGKSDKVRELLAAGVEPNGRPNMSGTAFANAAAGGHRNIVRMLLAAGANPNLATDDGYTPLIAAASVGAELIVADLLDAGAQVNATFSEFKNTALHIAARDGDPEVVRLLLEHGADPLLQTPGGATPRDVARSRKHQEVVDILLDAERQRSQ